MPTDFREREACAQIEYLGFMYAIDETGRVLHKSADLDAEHTLPIIKGASIFFSCIAAFTAVIRSVITEISFAFKTAVLVRS